MGRLGAIVRGFNNGCSFGVMRGTFALYIATRSKRGHVSNRSCCCRPFGITGVIVSLNVSDRSVTTSLLRSIMRSASCSIRCVGRRFNTRITLLISNIAGVNQLGFSAGRRRRTRDLEGVLVTVNRSVHMVVVGLTSHLRGVHAVSTVHTRGRESVSIRALRVCTPVTRHLNVHPIGRRLRSLTVGRLSPITCVSVRRLLAREGRRHRRVLGRVGTEVRRELERRLPGIALSFRDHIGSMRKVCHGVCVRGHSFSRVCSVCTVHVVASGMASYCGVLNVVRSVFEPVPGEFGSCVSAPGPGVCRSLRAAIVKHSKVPFRVRVHAFRVRRATRFNVTTR